MLVEVAIPIEFVLATPTGCDEFYPVDEAVGDGLPVPEFQITVDAGNVDSCQSAPSDRRRAVMGCWGSRGRVGGWKRGEEEVFMRLACRLDEE